MDSIGAHLVDQLTGIDHVYARTPRLKQVGSLLKSKNESLLVPKQQADSGSAQREI